MSRATYITLRRRVNILTEGEYILYAPYTHLLILSIEPLYSGTYQYMSLDILTEEPLYSGFPLSTSWC